MDLTIIANPQAPHQVAHAQALQAGYRRHGWTATIAQNARNAGDRVACWGWRIGKGLREAGKLVLVMERGYIGDRLGTWSSLAWNGLNNRGKVPAVPEDGGQRFRQHFDGMLKPWNTNGDYVLIVGQVPGDAALQGRDLAPWYAVQANRHWGRPVLFRPHPLARGRGPSKIPGAAVLLGDLDRAIRNAAWVVTFNSNTAVESYLAGKPTQVDDEGSMAWDVTDREKWAHRLAWRQWTIDEIASGKALEHVGLTDGA